MRRAQHLLWPLIFASGFAALVYQVLWMRELGLLFGSTAQAAAMAIAIFFTGLALGSRFWGRRARTIAAPLRGFGALEVGVALAACGHFLLLDAYRLLYPALFAVLGHMPLVDGLTKALLASLLLLPPSFLMGGTLPLLAEHLLRAEPKRLATLTPRLYALNTAGAATGALAAGFLLPVLFGFRGAYLTAIAIDLVVGLTALGLARRQAAPLAAAERFEPTARRKPASLPRAAVLLVAFVSGFATLGVEVIWTRLLAQVLQNSVYTYALVLSAFLLALAVGAALAGRLAAQSSPRPEPMLVFLLAASSLAIALSPVLVEQLTDGLGPVGAGLDWWGYVGAVAWLVLVLVALPAVVLGLVFPYLLRLEEAGAEGPGAIVGRLLAVNTTGAILGALAAGFLLLPTLGATRSLYLLAALYLGLVTVLAPARATPARVAGGAIAAAAAVALLVMAPNPLTPIRLDPNRGERLVALREGTDAHVAVIAHGRDRSLRVNNTYTLGSSRALYPERNQTLLPLLTHKEPRRVFFLGMGTGITAGAALYLPVERVVVCELLADVVDLAQLHFRPWVAGLFDDARVTIHAEDGRNCLARSPERFDVIIADLFTPWHAGTGDLYSLEHYQTARTRLLPGGLYVQWLPLYQVSLTEFASIANTMAAVFDQVVLWRGDLYPTRSIVALIGQRDPAPLDLAVVRRQARALGGGVTLTAAEIDAAVLRHYAGNVTASGLFEGAPLNTDDRPFIAQAAPRTQRAVAAGRTTWLTGEARDAFYAALAEAVPPAQDPYLQGLDHTAWAHVEAGRLLKRAAGLAARRDAAGRDVYEAAFRALDPAFNRRPLSPAADLLPTFREFRAAR